MSEKIGKGKLLTSTEVGLSSKDFKCLHIWKLIISLHSCDSCRYLNKEKISSAIVVSADAAIEDFAACNS